MNFKLNGKRFCYFIPADGYVEDGGFRVSVVFENEPGHSPTGTWPYHGHFGEKMPWFWGETYEIAKTTAREENKKLGLSDQDVRDIITSSMKGPGR